MSMYTADQAALTPEQAAAEHRARISAYNAEMIEVSLFGARVTARRDELLAVIDAARATIVGIDEPARTITVAQSTVDDLSKYHDAYADALEEDGDVIETGDDWRIAASDFVHDEIL